MTTLYNFCAQANCADGENPYAVLVQATDGNFYGTTLKGGSYSVGTVFKITPAGALTTLHSFDGFDGGNAYSGVIQAANGNFYGTTLDGVGDFGTVFEVTPSGTLTTLHSFNLTDGGGPFGGLVQATDGSLYGTTGGGGGSGNCRGGCGTVFRITAAGTFTLLHSFDFTDGENADAALVQGTNGTFYGTTTFGGYSSGNCSYAGCGTVFSLSVGLGPLIKLVPATGKIGEAVKIIGDNLDFATGVTFNGTPATFTVVSRTEISTTVPSGATTGPVQVTLRNGTLTSNVNFQVLP